MAMLGKKYQDGEIICRQGDAEVCMYAIQSGCVQAVREESGAAVVVGELAAGDFFGEMALFERQQHPARMRAKGETRVLTLDKEAFLRRVHEDPSFAFRLLEKLAKRIRGLIADVSQARRWSHDPQAETIAQLTMAGLAPSKEQAAEISRVLEQRPPAARRPRVIALAVAVMVALGLAAVLAAWRGWLG